MAKLRSSRTWPLPSRPTTTSLVSFLNATAGAKGLAALLADVVWRLLAAGSRQQRKVNDNPPEPTASRRTMPVWGSAPGIGGLVSTLAFAPCGVRTACSSLSPCRQAGGPARLPILLPLASTGAASTGGLLVLWGWHARLVRLGPPTQRSGASGGNVTGTGGLIPATAVIRPAAIRHDVAGQDSILAPANVVVQTVTRWQASHREWSGDHRGREGPSLGDSRGTA